MGYSLNFHGDNPMGVKQMREIHKEWLKLVIVMLFMVFFFFGWIFAIIMTWLFGVGKFIVVMWTICFLVGLILVFSR